MRSFAMRLVSIFFLAVIGGCRETTDSSIPTPNKRLEHMERIVKALYSYKDQHGSLPTPTFKHPESGQLRSWRVEILPQLGRSEFYQQYRADEAWASAANRLVLDQMPEVFCSRDWTEGNTTTRFLLPVGTGTLFDPKDRFPLWWLVRKDGQASTIMLLESPTTTVPWTKPEDLSINLSVARGPLETIGKGSNDQRVPSKYEWLPDDTALDLGGLAGQQFAAACPAGNAFFLSRNLDQITLRRLLCYADGDRITEDQYPRLSWRPCPDGKETADVIVNDPKQLLMPPPDAENPFHNSLGMQFVPVPIGCENDDEESNARNVLFSIYETRVSDYAAFADETPGLQKHWKDLVFGSTSQLPDHPVVSVSWEAAKQFCGWLTDKERNSGHIGLEDRYRLPTDYEWSCAVGIGGREDPYLLPSKKHDISRIFPWGTGWPPPRNGGNFQGTADSKVLGVPGDIPGYNDGFASVAPVGSFPANSLGIHDLAGNVSEWCADLWEGEPQRQRSSREIMYPTIRGSNFLSGDELHLAASYRAPEAEYGGYYTGFRCILESESELKRSAKTRPPKPNIDSISNHSHPSSPKLQKEAPRLAPVQPSNDGDAQAPSVEPPVATFMQDSLGLEKQSIFDSPRPSDTVVVRLREALADSRWTIGKMNFKLKSDGSLGGRWNRFRYSYWKVTAEMEITLVDKRDQVPYLRIRIHDDYQQGDAEWKDGTKRVAHRRD